jgi:hypothetical protein
MRDHRPFRETFGPQGARGQTSREALDLIYRLKALVAD